MDTLSRNKFFLTFPDVMISYLPPHLQPVQVIKWRWLIKFHFGEPRLHYELSRAARGDGWEIGLHFEARDRQLNQYLLQGFRRHLFEIKDCLGDSIEAEMWDKGWAKVYEVYPNAPLTTAYQVALGRRFAQVITCLHPFLVDLRRSAAQASGQLQFTAL